MLQGSRQSLICSFVFQELPKIYKLVFAKKPKTIEGNLKTKKTPSKPTVSCDQCKYKSSIIQMKMHIKTVHDKRPKRAAKRLSNFSPLFKSKKRSKIKDSLTILNAEGIVDDNSIFMLNDTFSGKDATLEELVVPDITMNFEPQKETVPVQNEPVQMKPMFSCEKCDFDCEVKGILNFHMKNAHETLACDNNQSNTVYLRV